MIHSNKIATCDLKLLIKTLIGIKDFMAYNTSLPLGKTYEVINYLLALDLS